MRRDVIFGLMVVAISLFACNLSTQLDVVRGSGSMAMEERVVEDIRGVTLATLGDLTIEVGTEELFVIEAEENLLPYLETEVREGTLTIRNKAGVSLSPTEEVHYYLTVKDLETLVVSSSGNIEAPAFEAQTFSIKTISSGDIHLQGVEAERLEVEIGSSGDITIDEGQVAHEEIRIYSSGAFSADDVRCESASVEITSSGHAHIWASDSLDANLSSSGNVNIYGDPEISQSTSSSGRVISMGGR